MREKLVRSDLVDCIIGLGKNLFYNSPMESCIVIARRQKPDTHKGYILFVNAVNLVTRKNAQSYLSNEQIEIIAGAYANYVTDNEIARKVSIRDIEANDFSLSIPLYVKKPSGEEQDERTMDECYDDWRTNSQKAFATIAAITNMIKGGESDE